MQSHLKNDSQQQSGGHAVDCTADPVASLKTMFVDMVMGRRLARGQSPALRPVFLKTHGAAGGFLRIRKDLPAEMRVGVFGHKEFPAWVRFSSDTLPSFADARTTLGIGIKLYGVPGKKLVHADAMTSDFLAQNHPVFFVDTARDMCEYTRAAVVDGNDKPYLDAHPVTARIFSDMEKLEPSVLTATYWGVLPHSFGAKRFVKYKLVPRYNEELQHPAWDYETWPNYLYFDLKTKLLRSSWKLDFFVQVRTDDAAMPLDQATVAWDETTSVPIHVATLVLPQQNIDAPGQAEYAERLSFNIWQTLKEHQPQGSIAAARNVAYAAAADLRRTKNQVPLTEPEQAQPIEPVTMPQDQKIVRAAIHPAIGIARVGNSSSEFFVGPEVPDAAALPPGAYKDKTGALKREAARFRIYGYNAMGKVVAELTPRNAVIEWTVHLANKKAAWYQFQLAMDIADASAPGAAVSRRRNPQVTGSDRQKLVIDPGPRSIHGCNTQGSTYRFDSGKFFDLTVPLGELRTDEEGRLLVLGGYGLSRSIAGQPPLDFANNDGWHDDISDGPVDARVTIDGTAIPVAGAWVAVAPPNYAPALKTVRTLYDVMFDIGLDRRLGWFKPPTKLTFRQHIKPIFERLSALQWVNQGFASVFGAQAPYDAAHLMDRLADASASNKGFRQQIVSHFRRVPADGQASDTTLWPYFYGDGIDSASSSRRLASLTGTQLKWLSAWGDGLVENDLDSSVPPPPTLDNAPLAKQPALLDEAALAFCLADAFHPGCELTWVMRASSLYNGPLRLRRRPSALPEAEYGDVLYPDVATSRTGPLSMSAPGDLTRWMAVPWQTDTASCLSGYSDFKTTDSLPTFWPARVPNDVLAETDYKILIDSTQPREKRREAFLCRRKWFRGFVPPNAIDQMISDFYKLGIVEERPGPADLPDLPQAVWVESKPDLPLPEDQEKVETTAAPGAAPAGAPSRFFLLRRLGKQATARGA
jgi:hypothetical protein